MANSGQANYVRSNAVTTVDVAVNETAKHLARKLLGAVNAADRQRLGEALLDALADAAQIDICALKVSDTRQSHRRVGGRTVFKQYGYYRPQSKYIYIQNRTAVRGQILAPKSFLETLLHEWLHHYDYQVLKLQSIHTAGFYARLRDLKQRLNIPVTV